ncbi:MAG: TIGR03032 family protein [Cyanobacteria bacterium RM1_2_2]|nr:TIGR03032 family protein [Cyanobacteria bacterium RM1_2_2]
MAPALQHYSRAVALQPSYLPALINLGSIQFRLKQFDAAAATFQQILQLQPNQVQILDSYLKLLLTTCHWAELPAWVNRFQQAVQTQLTSNQLTSNHPPHLSPHLSPLNSLFLPLSAETQKSIAEHHAREISQRMADLRQHLATAWQAEATPHSATVQNTDAATSKIQNPKSKIRLGYVSGDFRYHAVGQLILRLFELHDRRSFEVFAYCLNADDGSAEYRKLAADCDGFRVVQNWTPAAIAQQVHDDQIDILIDLAGYTNHACPELFALRPAPLQVNYLGYPGTLGADAIDYVITDAVITSPELAPTLTETCLYLPETYQVNCYPYPDADPAPAASRSQLKIQNSLPAEAFVFCCFNQSQKIEPTVFSAWMRILAQVPNSVLWLLSESSIAEANLQAVAADQGVDPTRLIFATRVPKADHLRRHVCADLFLDTLHYNAHVTASDSLWAGVPVLTVLGNTFASRVAASLLTAAGIPDLITPSLAAYEQLAVQFATDPTDLHLLKERLIRQRSTSPLFDTARTVRRLEEGFRLIWQRHQTGAPPTATRVIAEQRPVSAAIKSAKSAKSAKSTKTIKPVKTEHSASPHGFATGNTIACTADAGFLEWLRQSHGSLLVTTYQAGKVLLIGWNGHQVTLLARQFDKPMGVASTGDRIALTTRQEVLFFANARLLAHSYLEEQPGRYDALYLPRASYFTGDLNTHDLAFGQDGLWLVNTRFSCLASLSLEFNFVPRWYPAFISEIAPEDRCHLNGLAMVAGKPKYVTALGKTDTVGGWRQNKAAGGIVIDVETDEIVLRGLSMPHSPRWYQNKLWLLNSGTGELWQVDPVTWKPEVVCALPGFGRGLTIVGDYALIGLCQIREQHIFGGLPIQERFDQLLCGVAIVDCGKGSPWVG